MKQFALLVWVAGFAWIGVFAAPRGTITVNVNDVSGGSDSERINRAVRAGGRVIIPPRVSDVEPSRDWWLLDEAVTLPSDTTVILRDCRLKLSDKCRDNFFRSANCGFGFATNATFRNIHILGEGRAVLEGADHPRATGDGGKFLRKTSPNRPEDWLKAAYWLTPEERAKRKTPADVTFGDIHDNTYGTDAGKPGESQFGDWRNIGILFACVEDFSIENIRIVQAHGWNISLESCAYGDLRRIDFYDTMGRMIDGVLENIENQDGIDLRNGCHDITISDITGRTGDDVIALTSIAFSPFRPGGSLQTTLVMHNDWTKRERDIRNVVIRNVRAHSSLCFVVRLLASQSRIRNVVIDGIVENRDDGDCSGNVILIGDGGFYGTEYPDAIANISISNVIGAKHSGSVIQIPSALVDSTISNVINRNPNRPALSIANKDALKNVSLHNIVEPSK